MLFLRCHHSRSYTYKCTIALIRLYSSPLIIHVVIGAHAIYINLWSMVVAAACTVAPRAAVSGANISAIRAVIDKFFRHAVNAVLYARRSEITRDGKRRAGLSPSPLFECECRTRSRGEAEGGESVEEARARARRRESTRRARHFVPSHSRRCRREKETGTDVRLSRKAHGIESHSRVPSRRLPRPGVNSKQNDVISARRGPIIGLLILIRARLRYIRARKRRTPRRAEEGREGNRAPKQILTVRKLTPKISRPLDRIFTYFKTKVMRKGYSLRIKSFELRDDKACDFIIFAH